MQIRYVVWRKKRTAPLRSEPTIASTRPKDSHCCPRYAIRATFIGLGTGTFAPFLGMNDMKDIAPVMQLWRRVVGLLAKYPEA